MPYCCNTSSFSEYVERIKERSCDTSGREMLRCCVWRLLLSADRHMTRFDLAARRYARAVIQRDVRARESERENMLALLYESADTLYMVIQMMDPDVLELHSSLDGAGISGEDAAFCREIIARIEKIAARILREALEHNLQLDFSKPVDEREGVTYTKHCHWRDFVEGSMERSFYLYFREAQEAVKRRLAQVPRFWTNRPLRQVYLNERWPATAKLLRALLVAALGRERLIDRVERSTETRVRRHWPLLTEGEFARSSDWESST